MCSICLYLCGPPRNDDLFLLASLNVEHVYFKDFGSGEAVEYRQRRSRSTFLLLTLLTTCLLQQCIARPRQLWTEITFLLLTLLTTCLLQQCIARPRELWTEITFLLLTLLITCLLQQCIARPRELWTEIRSDCCAIIYFLLTTLGPFSLLSYRSKTWWEYVVLQTFYDSNWLDNF